MTDMKYLGKTTDWKSDQLDIIPNPGIDFVEFTTHELTAHCPVTGAPDIYTAVIKYGPDNWIVESKSLKLVMMSFRDQQIFAEALCIKIAKIFFTQVQPVWVRVELTQQVRGGLQLRCEKEMEVENGQ